MNSQDKEKKGKERTPKRASIAWDDNTINAWQETLEQLNLFENSLLDQTQQDSPNDALNEKMKTKFLINEATLIDYVLTTLELMTQCREYSEDSFIIALRNVGEMQRKKIKIMLTSFVDSYRKQVPYSNELAYFTVMLEPQSLPNKNHQIFSFYLKLRKYIFANYVNDRDQFIKPLNFDQWVSVVSKFMDNTAISQIGNRIKDHLAPKKNNEKIIKNNVQPFDLLIFCYELQVERTQVQQPKKRQIATFNPMQKEDYSSTKSKPTAQQLAYKMMIPQTTNSVKGDITEEQRKRKLKQLVDIHEDLAYHYKLLANFVTDSKEIIRNYVEKVRNSEPITENELIELEQLSQFNQFLQVDPEVNLMNTGVHEYL